MNIKIMQDIVLSIKLYSATTWTGLQSVVSSPVSELLSSIASIMQDLGFGVNKQGETWERVTQIRDKFEYDRERRMRERGKFIFGT